AVPLLFFAAAARRLPLSTLGFLQYLSPTLQFLLAVFAYGEAFDRAHAVAFALTWTAVAVFSAHRAGAAARFAGGARSGVTPPARRGCRPSSAARAPNSTTTLGRRSSRAETYSRSSGQFTTWSEMNVVCGCRANIRSRAAMIASLLGNP